MILVKNGVFVLTIETRLGLDVREQVIKKIWILSMDISLTPGS